MKQEPPKPKTFDEAIEFLNIYVEWVNEKFGCDCIRHICRETDPTTFIEEDILSEWAANNGWVLIPKSLPFVTANEFMDAWSQFVFDHPGYSAGQAVAWAYQFIFEKWEAQ